MAERFGTADWAKSLEREINASSEYRNAASGWGVGFNGDVLMVFEADDALRETKRLLLHLSGGSSSGVEFVGAEAEATAGFVLSAPFSLWKEILERKTLAATAILTGRLKVRGDKTTLLRHIPAHRALVHCAASLDTRFDALEQA